ncbi:uncharacterized protein LOC132200747 isoform X2 [Neocloeon triangulifer]|uniref:uncharacterized protein LOC132200747 isoform X2 n=1 Tax=Neocloeon triangulifer TaxID=2078957 RepID=UPI00286ED0D3|nr:uncharacterized protein LOC132200747 isoform X2 [Neocloeon triangulifer]
MAADTNNSCILCESIAGENSLLIADLDKNKFANWWLENFDVEIEKSVLDGKSARVCKFCIHDARNTVGSDRIQREIPIDWWTVASCDSSNSGQEHQQFCDLVLEPLKNDEVALFSATNSSSRTLDGHSSGSGQEFPKNCYVVLEPLGNDEVATSTARKSSSRKSEKQIHSSGSGQEILRNFYVVLEPFAHDEVASSSATNSSSRTSGDHSSGSMKKAKSKSFPGNKSPIARAPRDKDKKLYYTCFYCHRRTAHMIDHLKIVHKLKCVAQCRQGLCRQYLAPQDLQPHISKYHFGGNVLICEVCKYVFTNSIHHKLHVKYAHRDVKAEYEKLINVIREIKFYKAKLVRPEAFAEWEQTIQIVFVKCVFCNEEFKCIDALKKHVEFSHKDIDAIMCTYPDCNEFFDLKDDLVTHLKTAHPYLTEGKLEIGGESKTAYFKCNFSGKCNTIFKSDEEVAEHIFNEHTDSLGMRTACFYCKMFVFHKSMSTHLKKVHHATDVLKCPAFDCHQMYLEYADWWTHLESYHKDQFKTATDVKTSHILLDGEICCQICNNKYKSDLAFLLHLKQFHKFETVLSETSFKNIFRKCTECPLYFQTKMALSIHLKHVHEKAEGLPSFFNASESLMQSEVPVNSQSKDVLDPKRLAEPTLTPVPAEQTLPLTYVSEASESLSQSASNELNAENETQTTIEQTVCVYCDVEYEDLKEHLLSIHKLKNVAKCTHSGCSQYLACEDLESHIENQHTVQDMSRCLICRICKKLFINHVYHKLHMRYAHELDSAEINSSCSKETNQINKPDVYLRQRASGAILVSCIFCNKRVAGHLLINHIRLVHKRIDERRCHYPDCHEVFELEGDLVTHLKREHPYLTEKKFEPDGQIGCWSTEILKYGYKFADCHTNFANYKEFEEHIYNKHSDCLGKKMSCFYCKKYCTYAAMSYHLFKVHNASDILKCPVEGCFQMFIEYSDWWAHIKKYHKHFFKFDDSIDARKKLLYFEVETTALRCNQCQFIFHAQKSFVTHLKQYHNYKTYDFAQLALEPLRKCLDCKLSLRSRVGMEIHIKYAHKYTNIEPNVAPRTPEVSKLMVAMKGSSCLQNVIPLNSDNQIRIDKQVTQQGGNSQANITNIVQIIAWPLCDTNIAAVKSSVDCSKYHGGAKGSLEQILSEHDYFTKFPFGCVSGNKTVIESKENEPQSDDQNFPVDSNPDLLSLKKSSRSRHATKIHAETNKTEVEGPTCIYCNYVGQDFPQHFFSFHKLKTIMKCGYNFCKDQFTLEDWQMHMKNEHTGKCPPEYDFKCRMCNKCFANEVHHKLHTRYAHRDKKSLGPYFELEFHATKKICSRGALQENEDNLMLEITCIFCGKIVKSRWINSHLRNMHSDIKIIHCSYPKCYEVFDVKSDLIEHLKSDHPYILEINNYLEETFSEIDKPEIKCSFSSSCSREFKTVEAMKEHILNFHALDLGSKMPCLFCGRYFSYGKALNGHLQIKHPHWPVLECYVFGCYQMFKDYTDLWAHVQSKHPKSYKVETLGNSPHFDILIGDGNNVCKHCGEQLKKTGRFDVMRHLRETHHYSKYNFDHFELAFNKQCPKCPIIFKEKKGLDAHVEYKHPKLSRPTKRKRSCNDEEVSEMAENPVECNSGEVHSDTDTASENGDSSMSDCKRVKIEYDEEEVEVKIEPESDYPLEFGNENLNQNEPRPNSSDFDTQCFAPPASFPTVDSADIAIESIYFQQ